MSPDSQGADRGSDLINAAHTNRVRADSGLPHVSLFGAQVGDLHPQPGRQGLHVTRQPGERQETGRGDSGREEGFKRS